MDQEIHDIIHGIAFKNIEKHPNILIAGRFWDEKRYQAAKVCYKFMRMIDDLIDDRKAKEEVIGCMEREALLEKVNYWIECLVKDPDQDPLIKELTDTISTFQIPVRLFHNFAKSMRYDIDNNGFDTLDDFLAYAEGASVAPASVFVHLCSLTEQNGTYHPAEFDVVDAARPCALFSYIVHIIRDFQEDQQHNLNYFATDILRKHHLTPSDLKTIAMGGPVIPSFREVIREYHQLAQQYSKKTLEAIEKLSSRLNGRYLFSLHLIYHLYKTIFDRIDIEQGLFTSRELNPSPEEIRATVWELASDWNGN
jgi:phytoene/squalene synthetase